MCPVRIWQTTRKEREGEKGGERPNPDSPTFFLFLADIHPLEKEEEEEAETFYFFLPGR